MEVLIQAIIGFVIVPAFNWVKARTGLKGTAAAWVLLVFVLCLAVPVTLVTGGLAGLKFDPTDPIGFLKAVAQAFLIILGSAEGLYMITKPRAKA